MLWIYISVLCTVIVQEVFPSVWVQLADSSNIDKYLPGTALRTVHPCGYQQCKKQCERKTDCSHINFIRHNFTCLLMLSNGNSIPENKKGAVFSKKSGSGICSDISCANDRSTCIRTTPGTNVCIEDVCSSEYKRFGNPSICIKYDNIGRNWTAAADYCAVTGGRLMILDTEQKIVTLREFVTVHSLTYSYFWIGARKHSDQTWKWENGNLVENSETWWHDEECLEFYEQNPSSWTCAEQSTNTVCEEV